MQLVIDPRGQVVCLYTEELNLSAMGGLSIRRASHVRLDGVDHALHGRLDQTQRVLDAIAPFLRELGQSRDWEIDRRRCDS